MNYLVDVKTDVSAGYKGKCLGAMEMLLILSNKLCDTVPYDFKEIEVTFNFLWLFPFKYKRLETYEEHIIRITDSVIGESE